MDIETWVAIASALIALATLPFSGRAAGAARRGVKASETQTKLQQQLRVDSAQPYVWVDVRPDEAVGTLLNLVVGNSGPTVATNVRVSFDPLLPVVDELKDSAESAQARLAAGLPSLPPGRVLTWTLGQGFNLIRDDGPQRHTVTVVAEGPFGPMSPLTYVIDMADWRGVLNRPTGSLHQLTLAVRDLANRA